LVIGSEEWRRLLDEAAIARDQISSDLLTDEQILNKLPAFFRAIGGTEITTETLGQLVEAIKEVNKPIE
jgi:hypothetical protein